MADWGLAAGMFMGNHKVCTKDGALYSIWSKQQFKTRKIKNNLHRKQTSSLGVFSLISTKY